MTALVAYALARRFVGAVRELPGADHHPFVQWCHMLCALGADQPDETAWCSSFVNAIHWMVGLPRSGSAAARSWLKIGQPCTLHEAREGDIVVLSRGTNPAHGHVGFFAGRDAAGNILILGGNQGNTVSIEPFDRGRLLSIQRVA